MSDKPRVLVLGGCGFVGRHLVTYIVKNNLASLVVVADKVLYQIAGLSKQELEIFENKEKVSYKQADLSNEGHVERVFTHEGGNFRYVFNCAAVAKYSQNKEVYDINITQLKKVCATAAVKHKVARYIDMSTAQVYKSQSKAPATESSPIEPWTGIGVASYAGEQAIKSIAGLNYVIVRPAVIYGTGDVLGLTPRLIIGSIYMEKGKEMQTLYTKDLKVNTVHVNDVVRAMWFLTSHGNSGAVYNLVDKNNTDQGKIHKLLEAIYGIKTSFVNSILMSAAKQMSTKSLVNMANDKHLKPFSDFCKKYNIKETPLTPYLDEELITENNTFVDGSAIEGLGFKYEIPAPTPEILLEVLNDFVQKGVFPREMAGKH